MITCHVYYLLLYGPIYTLTTPNGNELSSESNILTDY